MADVLPLAHLTVLDLTIARAGPTAVRVLTDWARTSSKSSRHLCRVCTHDILARVRGLTSNNLHRNKRGLALDLKKPEGKAVFRDLLKEADIVVENYRSDVKTRLGVDYETLAALNPRIILASISGSARTVLTASGPCGSDRPG